MRKQVSDDRFGCHVYALRSLYQKGFPCGSLRAAPSGETDFSAQTSEQAKKSQDNTDLSCDLSYYLNLLYTLNVLEVHIPRANVNFDNLHLYALAYGEYLARSDTLDGELLVKEVVGVGE